MSADREALREAVAGAVVARRKLPEGSYINWPAFLADADAALAVIIPACQEAIRERGPATQDMRSTEICDALDAAADALSTFLPEK